MPEIPDSIGYKLIMSLAVDNQLVSWLNCSDVVSRRKPTSLSTFDSSHELEPLVLLFAAPTFPQSAFFLMDKARLQGPFFFISDARVLQGFGNTSDLSLLRLIGLHTYLHIYLPF